MTDTITIPDIITADNDEQLSLIQQIMTEDAELLEKLSK